MTVTERLRAALALPLAPDMRLLPGDTGHAEIDRGLYVGAAVLMPIVDRREPTMLLTLRNEQMRKHPGQVAFPGGRIDPGDAGAVEAALREAHEEIGLPGHVVDVIGTLDAYRTGTGYAVTPVLAVVPPDLPLVPHEAEVAAVFEVPLAHLQDRANWAVGTIDYQGAERRYYEIMWQDRRIWGATAAMIVNLGRRLAMAR